MFPSSSSRLVKSADARQHPRLLNWFRNLPIGRKQLIALFTCELVPILGFGIGSTLVLQNSLRTQLLAQAKSEVAVTEINYNIKINQMGFGSRGQSDNETVITAARDFQRNDNLPSALKDKLREILLNEVKARKMEYATLVSRDLRIIGNANANRTREKITAQNLTELIQQSIKDGQQIKASEIVSWDELNKESPPLPEGLNQQDALIRYVVTPVRERGEILGVLVFGDIVDRKLPIVENTLNAFGGGYSAVYMNSPGGFKLSTSLDKADVRSPQFGNTLATPKILEAAVAAKGETVTDRVQVGEQTYTIAAKAMPNRVIETPDKPVPVMSDRPVAILVRGTPEGGLYELMGSSLQQEAIVFLLSIAAILFWSMWFRRLVIKPIENLQETTEEFTAGNRNVRAEVFSEDEVGQLAIAFNRMANSLTSSETALAEEAVRQERQAKEARALSEITVRMRRSLSSDSILQTAIDEIRSFLRLDRVLVYKFNNSSLDGNIIAESIAQDALSRIGEAIPDLLGLERFEQYNQKVSWSLNDRDTEQISDRYRENLETLGVKAEIVAPLKRNNRLVGLICAQQCLKSRTWEESEIYFLTQMSAQIGYALDQAQLLQERQEALKDSETLKDSLQQQIIQLLGEVQGASRGDLTVRANVVDGDLGTVADFFNTIVESLHQLVIKVKQSAIQVNALLSENGDAIAQLSSEAQQQAQETIRTLNAVEQMTEGLQGVSDRAHQAATVAQNATEAAQSGEELMDTTVTSIYSLRATIEDATRKVKHLGESSQQIGRIVSLINDLAVQTDLLAINANIEASRAGEYGRGFGIVATEIGELATRSASATREIASMIEAIQEQTHEVVEVMSHGATQVVEGSHLARNAKQSLIHVVQVSRQIDDLVKSISDMVETQTQTSRSLTGLIKDISAISDRTSSSSHRVSDALRQTVDVAEELKASVDQFKVTGA